MSVHEQHREDVFRKLGLLHDGFVELAEIDGEGCVPMEREGRIGLPGDIAAVFLRLGVPEAALADGPLPLTVRTAEGRTLHAGALEGPDTWLPLNLDGAASALEIEVGRSWPSDLVGLGPSRPLGLLLRDVEFLKGELRPVFDLAAAERADRRFLTMRIDLTNKCNLRCRMCPLSFDEIFYQRKRYADVEEFRALAERVLPRTVHLALSVAYEPLLHPRLPELLAIVRGHGVPFVEFTTNGTLLTERVMNALIDQGVDRVTFSIDGATADTYEHVRRGADFEKFLAGLALFDRTRKERGVRHPEMSFNVVLMRSNVGELADVVRLGARFGLDVLHTSLLVPHVGLRMEDEALQHDRERANRAFAEARRAGRELGIPCFVPDDFDLSLAEEPVEALPVTPEYTLAEDWGKGRRRRYTLTDQEVVAADEHERERAPAASAEAPAEPVSGEPAPAAPAPPRYERLAPLPEDGADGGPEPKTFRKEDGSTMIRPGHASTVKEAVDGDGNVMDTSCIYPWTMAIVDADGRVSPCCHWYDWTSMGDLSRQTFEEVWNGPEYQRLRLELQTGRFRPCCLHCPERRHI